MLRITILAARRVLPPLLMTPAKASYPFMNDTGPDAVPPPASSSFDERMGDRFEPVPEPYLNSIPSVLARERLESIVSPTELMKHDQHCGTSTSFCSKTFSPFSLPMTAGRMSHSTSSNGSIPGRVK